MPSKTEKDQAAAVPVRSHEWDGIQEYDNPLPRWWLYVFYACIAWALVWFVLYPSWPTLNGHTKGLLGYTQRSALEEELAAVKASRAPVLDRIRAADLADVRHDPELLSFALAGGRVAFGDNCATCHGAGGAGNPGYPTLADDDWLWGGTLDDIYTTLRYGIRSGHEETRESEMPRFGADSMLDRAEINDVVEFVLSLSGRGDDAVAAARGAAIFADNCAACHGDDGTGDRDLGAPNLTDAVWLFGADKKTVRDVVTNARNRVMPAWVDRLDDTTLRMLTVYVHELGGGE